jgi:hypothetical protein
LDVESLLDKAQKQQDLVVMSYDSKGTTKALYEPKTSYKIDRIEVIVDENNRFINEYKMEDFVRRNPKVSSDMVSIINLLDSIGQFRHAIFTIGKIFSMINKIKTHIAFGGINLIV